MPIPINAGGAAVQSLKSLYTFILPQQKNYPGSEPSFFLDPLCKNALPGYKRMPTSPFSFIT